jgi:hypothetical protein
MVAMVGGEHPIWRLIARTCSSRGPWRTRIASDEQNEKTFRKFRTPS